MSPIYPNRNKHLHQLVLFDLDGTLVDTAPDLVGAINTLRREHSLQPLGFSDLRSIVSAGSVGLIEKGFGMTLLDSEFDALKTRFLCLYEEREHRESHLFDGVGEVLEPIERTNTPWGIVTNKPARFAVPLIDRLGLGQRACCLISPDDVPEPKPHPAAVILACEQQNVEPFRTLFVGDGLADITAGKEAGTNTLAALYGYIPTGVDPLSWGSDGCVARPGEIINWV